MQSSLDSLPLSGKVGVTLFLVLIWFGYMLAALNAKLAVGSNAGSIAEHYGDHSLTKAETHEIKEKGFAEEEVMIDHGEEHLKEENKSITPQEIVQLGHVHILGFSLLFISLGIILFLSNVGESWKIIIMFLLFLFFFLDIGGLFLVRFVSGSFAVLSFVSGIGTGVGIAAVSLIALYDMWLQRR